MRHLPCRPLKEVKSAHPMIPGLHVAGTIVLRRHPKPMWFPIATKLQRRRWDQCCHQEDMRQRCVMLQAAQWPMAARLHRAACKLGSRRAVPESDLAARSAFRLVTV
jgi:hypothetical protein